jgi:hypothetical protein
VLNPNLQRQFQFKFMASTLSAHLEAVPQEARLEPFPFGAYAFAFRAVGFFPMFPPWLELTQGRDL